MMTSVGPLGRHVLQEKGTVTKKEIVKQIADEIEETQLKTKEIVQLTFNAIVDTLIRDRRIELRNFGVFEVRLRKARKARNPRTEEPVNVPPKFVVTFKPGKEMEERVGELRPTPEELAALQAKPKKGKAAGQGENGVTPQADGQRPKKKRARKASQT
jgi:nucleoid DNA-binding protein